MIIGVLAAQDNGLVYRRVEGSQLGGRAWYSLTPSGKGDGVTQHLHDLFAVPFDEIAPLIEHTPAATRELED